MISASVIIVSYNAEKFIADCLRSVFNSHNKNFEVVVVENGSSDRSLKILENLQKKFSFKLIKNSLNLGSCRARNQGVKASSGEYIIFLDDDVVVDKNLIGKYVAAFEKDRTIGSIHGKSLNLERKGNFDSAGELFDSFGFLQDRAGGAKDNGQFDCISPIVSGKACSCAYRRNIFEKIGGFDEDFFFLVEEPDLDMRVWLSGYKVIFLPKAVCWHAFNTSFKNRIKYYSNYLVRYYGARNYLLMHLKNWEWRTILKILPMHLLSFLGLSITFLIKGQFREAYYILKGLSWNFLNGQKVLAKRRIIQKKIRKIKDKDLGFLFTERRPITYYFLKLKSYVSKID